MEREVGGGIGMGNTCKLMAVSFHCMTKSTTIKKFFLKSILPVFSLGVFIVFSLTFMSFIHLEFIFLCDVREFSNLIFKHVVVQYSEHHLLLRWLFLHCIFFPPLL